MSMDPGVYFGKGVVGAEVMLPVAKRTLDILQAKYRNIGALPGEGREMFVDQSDSRRVDFMLSTEDPSVKELVGRNRHLWEQHIPADLRLATCRVYLSSPGSPNQTRHRDCAVGLSVYQVFVTIQPHSAGMGHTRFFPGTHHGGSAGAAGAAGAGVCPTPSPGDFVVAHEAVEHYGSANHSTVPRFLLCLEYGVPGKRTCTYKTTSLLLDEADVVRCVHLQPAEGGRPRRAAGRYFR